MTNTKSTEAVNRVPNERLEDLIHEVMTQKMNEQDCKMRFQEFDVTVRKEVDQSVFVDLHIYGMADDTTKDQFVDPKGAVINGGGSIVVKLDDDSAVKFVFADIVNLNATDYQVNYRLV
jgi:hypothetical protein